MNLPDGSHEYQHCPRCGGVNRVGFLWEPGNWRACTKCSWKIDWVGPLWGVAKR